eukprot:120436-Chlamydomonas_euryale.AAC.3
MIVTLPRHPSGLQIMPLLGCRLCMCHHEACTNVATRAAVHHGHDGTISPGRQASCFLGRLH